MQNLIQEILKENNKAFLPRLNETQPVEVLFDFELITIREVVSLHTPVKKKLRRKDRLLQGYSHDCRKTKTEAMITEPGNHKRKQITIFSL